MQLRTITDGATWDSAVAELPMAHVLQSWAWGEFKRRWGWDATRLLWSREGRPVAAAQLLRRALPGTPLGIGYIAKGPCVDPDDAATVARVLCDIESEGRRQRLLFVKLDADVPADHAVFTSLLQRRGWRPSSDQIQFRNTAVLDLRCSEDELLGAMKSKTRYNIRLAERKGVEIRPCHPDDLVIFYDMYRETAQRDGFLIRPMDYYMDAWKTMLAAKQANLLMAWYKDEPLAGVMLFCYGPTVVYFYGASTNQHRETMPNHALQWAAIQWGKAQGYSTYDLWGAPDNVEDEADSLAGVWRFKQGFGAHFRPQIGAWDFPVTTAGYGLYTRALPALLNWVRRRRGLAPVHTSAG